MCLSIYVKGMWKEKVKLEIYICVKKWLYDI